MKYLFPIIAILVSFEAFCQGQFQKETAGSLTFVSGQVMQLAQAIPADKYSYAPQAGVRSLAEVCAHIISANLKMETLEKDLKTKDAIAKDLKRSYDLMIAAIKNANDASLATKVEFPFPGEFTGMSAILISLGHSNEHLGQLIAYARMNGITPPWSQSK